MGEMGVELNEDVRVAENTAINRLNEGRNKCNCRRRDQCPLQNQCLLENVIYRGMVQTEGREYRYIGACSTKFKARWANHKHSFANSKLRNTTSIAKLVHELNVCMNVRACFCVYIRVSIIIHTDITYYIDFRATCCTMTITPEFN